MANKSNGLNKGEKTRILLLNTAERLFGQNGVTATSLREVMKVADVNMAMVHYYFKNKDGLLDAILERRLVPINQARLNLLGQYPLEAGGQPLGMDDIIRAYVEPFIRLRDKADELERRRDTSDADTLETLNSELDALQEHAQLTRLALKTAVEEQGLVEE